MVTEIINKCEVEKIEIMGDPVKIAKNVKRTETSKQETPDLSDLNKKFDKRFQTVREKVIKILKEDEFARKKDWWLVIRLWASSGHIKLITPMDKLLEINAPESVSRIRRSLIKEAKNGNQDLKFLLKDNDILDDRNKKAEESRDVWGYKRSLELGGNISGEFK